MKQTIRRSGHSALFASIFLLLACTSVMATTFQPVEKECPICSTMVTGHVPGSTFIAGMSPDFRPLGGIDWTISSLLECQQCGFVSLSSRYDDASGLNTNKIKAILAELETTPLFAHLDRAIATEKNWKKDPQLLAKLILAAKWLADDTGEKDLVSQRRVEAIAAQEHVLKLTTPDTPEEAELLYLIGELNRQAGHKKKALELFAKAENNADENLLSLIQQQRAVAGGHHKQPDLNDLDVASDDDKLAAIPYLRERTDPEALAFLREFCLQCPDAYRERAIDALSGETPLKQHIPIYLEGLRNAHYRTVQGSARAVEALQVREAAPIIADVLTNPVENTEMLLEYALVATATSNEVEFLATYTEMEGHLVFNALLNTRSANAVPHILNLLPKLNRRSVLIRFFGEKPFRQAADFPALLNALPDLSTANPTNSAAIFKAKVFQNVQAPVAEKQLLAGTMRGGELGYTCALVLAARGNPVCKDMLMDGLTEHFGSAYFLYPILEPEDYGLLLQKRKAGLEKDLAILKKIQKENLSSQLDDEDKQYWQREIESIEQELKQPPVQWVGLLAATGNPKAKPLCLELLSASDTDTRFIAIDALAHIYDDEIGTALIMGCTQKENRWMEEVIFEVLGEYGNANTANQMMELVEQPTRVSFKLNWLNTMKKLAPERARPIAQEWTSSPNHDLSMAAQEFLE